MTLRATALLALAAFAVHEARYLLVPDGHADAGHGYLTVAPVLLGLLLALAAGRSLAALGRRTLPAGRGLTWAAASAALLGLHGAQEALERLLAGGGPVDLGVLVVVPLCAVAGAVVAAALRRADELLADAAAPALAPRLRLAAPALVAARAAARSAAATGLARNLAGRAPPSFG
jgi:hypothetical protein